MSGDTIGTALDSLVLVGGGLGFARLGLGGLRSPRAAAAEPAQDAATLPPSRSTGWQVLSALVLLFGGAIALCGLILALTLLFPGSGS